MRRVLTKGGAVFWRSASKKPWYVTRSLFTLPSSFSFSLIVNCELTIYRYINKFIKNGFQVEALAIRESGTKEPIDRVNMVCRSLFDRLSVEF